MYVCNECDYESAKPGKHCGKPMVEKKEEDLGQDEEIEEESFEEEE